MMVKAPYPTNVTNASTFRMPQETQEIYKKMRATSTINKDIKSQSIFKGMRSPPSPGTCESRFRA